MGSGGHAASDTLDGIENLAGSAHADTLTGDASANILQGGAGGDTLNGGGGDDEFHFREGFGADTIGDYTLGTSQDASEKIHLCMGTAENPPTQTGTDSGSNHVITVTFDGATTGTITLTGITTSSTNFTNLNVQIFAADDDGNCLTAEPEPEAPPPPPPPLDALQAWFTDDTPRQFAGRLYLLGAANRTDASGTCRIASASSNCPPGTSGSVPITGNVRDTIEVEFTATSRGETASRTHEVVIGGPAAPWLWVSGGNGKLLVGWDESPAAVTGQINAYIVQVRRQNADESWPGWTSETKAATDREHTFTGLDNGTWQVRIRARNNAGDTDDATHIMGTTSEVRTVTLASVHRNTPGAPTEAAVAPDSGKLVITWQPPASDTGSLVHGYTVRHKESSAADSAYVETTVHPRRVDFECKSAICTNPRTLEITGLTAGTDYVVGIRSHNANGDSAWHTIGTTHTPN